MYWFWKLLGWRKFCFGKNTLWLRGAKIEDLPEFIVETLNEQQETELTMVLNIR